MGLVLITHDLGIVARIATRVVVMYAGQVVETGTAQAIFSRAGASLYARAARLHSGARQDAARRAARHHPRHGAVADRRDARLPLRRPLPVCRRGRAGTARSRWSRAERRTTWCAASAMPRSPGSRPGRRTRWRHEPGAASKADEAAPIAGGARRLAHLPRVGRAAAGQAHAACGRRRQPVDPAGRGGGAGRRVRLRQDHAGAHAARPAGADRRARSASAARPSAAHVAPRDRDAGAAGVPGPLFLAQSAQVDRLDHRAAAARAGRPASRRRGGRASRT